MTTPQPYIPNEPLPDEFLSTSQINFLYNFRNLYNAFFINHVPLDAASGAGNHKVIQMLEQPIPLQTGVGEISLYSKDVSDQTDQLFMRYQGNGTEFQFTNYQIYTLSENQWFTFLPGKLLIYFGVVTIPGYPYILNLNPPVAKNIIGINFCAQTSPSQPPLATILAPQNGFITKISLQTPFGLVLSETMYYLVIANI